MTIKSVFNRIKEELIQCFQIVFNDNVYIHIGIKPKNKIMNGNVGDSVLYELVEEVWVKILMDHGYDIPKWVHRDIRHRLNKFHIWLYNRFAKMIVIGGGGLFMADLPWAKNSGWLFDTKKENVLNLNIPLIIFAVGFNVFRNLSDFNQNFKGHLNITVEKSLLFGLRNNGSLNAISEFLTVENKKKIRLQPCPTTFLSKYHNINLKRGSKKVGICLAFDRFESRFPISFSKIIDRIEVIEKQLESYGYETVYFIHSTYDLECVQLQELKKRKRIELVSEKYMSDIFEFYSDKIMIIGMRGHSLMIPFGMKIPVISLTTQDKQRFFMELINHPERSIEVIDENLSEKVINQIDIILNNYGGEIKEIDFLQREFYKLTIDNINFIEKNKH